jgi:dihydroneopterin aldolase
MSDLIRVADLEVFSRIGVPDEERLEPQRLLVSLEMRVESISEAAKSDDLLLTVNYYQVAQRVKTLAATGERKLIETLAEELATVLLKEFQIGKLTVEIKKFVLPEAQYVSVRIERPQVAKS